VGAHRGDRRDVAGEAAGAARVARVEAHHAGGGGRLLTGGVAAVGVFGAGGSGFGTHGGP
jgi:hypothetical protein